MEKLLTSEFWMTQIDTVMKAPGPVIVLLALAVTVTWWLRKTVDDGEIRELRAVKTASEAARNASEERLNLAREKTEIADRKIELLRSDLNALKSSIQVRAQQDVLEGLTNNIETTARELAAGLVEMRGFLGVTGRDSTEYEGS